MDSIIADSDFSTFGERGSRWAILSHAGVEVSPVVKDSVLALEIAKTRGANWHGELRYSPFPVRAGDTFTVSFEAKARHPFTFSVWLGQQNAPYQSLVPEENHFGEARMTPDWQGFRHTWRPILTEEGARLNIVLGQIDNLVEIKHVTLVRS